MPVVLNLGTSAAGRRLARLLALALLGTTAGALIGCAGSAVNLRPDNIPKGHGAVFGHVELFYGEKNITSGAHVTFMDASNETKAEVAVDDTGWVFTTVEQGLTRLKVGIAVIDISLNIPAESQIVYFGHVRVDAPPIDTSLRAFAFLDMKSNSVIANHFDQAKREYENRYGVQAALLVPHNSLASTASQLDPAQRRSAATPAGTVALFFGIGPGSEGSWGGSHYVPL